MRVALLVLTVGLFFGCATDRAADRAAIADVLTAQQQAWNRGDIDAFMAGYDKADDIIFTSGGKVRRGYAATLEKYRKSYVAAKAMGKLGFQIVEVRWLGPDAALLMGRYRLTETPKAGSGLFTLIFERRPDGWKCVHDHTSSNPKP